MIDAERLRLRGLTKCQITRTTRRLHRLYTWIEIVGKRTCCLHDHGAYSSIVETLVENVGPHCNSAATWDIARLTGCLGNFTYFKMLLAQKGL